MKGNTCAFTGHRPYKLPWKYNERADGCIALKTILTEQIMLLAKAGVTEFYSGMAEGTDLFCSEIVLGQRKKNPALRLHCVLPCEGQADMWSSSAQERYYGILRQADSVDYVSQKYYDKCMLDRNRRLVESAGILLAVYNGEWRGGTAATVRYARKIGREIIVIDPVTQHITHEGPASDLKI